MNQICSLALVSERFPSKKSKMVSKWILHRKSRRSNPVRVVRLRKEG